MEIKSIESFERYTEEHLNNSNDNCKFHFKGIDESSFICTLEPNVIYSKSINTIWTSFYNGITLLFVATFLDNQWYREKFIINPSTINREQSHKKNHILDRI